MASEPPLLDDGVSRAYVVTLLVILSTGLVGNVITAFILIKRPYRFRPLSHLMLNITVADMIICSTGYPVALAFMMVDPLEVSDRSMRCAWLAFINCFTGLASVGSLTCISWCLFKATSGISPFGGSQISASSHRQNLCQVFGVWVYAFVLSSPPFFGWNRFVPVASRVSCHPQWASQNPNHLSYIVFLVIFGFFLPLCIIAFCQGSVYRILKRSCPTEPTDSQQKKRRSLRRAMRMTCVIIVVFFISWSPYCVVSLAATCSGGEVLSPALALLPAVLAKASVVYNPLVYTAMNRRFRRYFCKLISFGKFGESLQS